MSSKAFSQNVKLKIKKVNLTNIYGEKSTNQIRVLPSSRNHWKMNCCSKQFVFFSPFIYFKFGTNWTDIAPFLLVSLGHTQTNTFCNIISLHWFFASSQLQFFIHSTFLDYAVFSRANFKPKKISQLAQLCINFLEIQALGLFET